MCKPTASRSKPQNGTRIRIPTRTVIWAAGVEASPLARALGEACDAAEIDRAGRLLVDPDLTLPGHPEVLAFGDMVRVRDPHTGQPHALPGIAPVAMQQGRYAGRLVANRLAGRPTPPFHYRNKGTLATIGRAHAVADITGVRLSGRLAWCIWLIVHLGYLVGFENRMLVLLRWSLQLHHPRTRHPPNHQGRGHPANTGSTSPRHSTRTAPISPMRRPDTHERLRDASDIDCSDHHPQSDPRRRPNGPAVWYTDDRSNDCV